MVNKIKRGSLFIMVIVLCGLALSGCVLPMPDDLARAVIGETEPGNGVGGGLPEAIIVTADPNAAPTATPFLPLSPTEMIQPPEPTPTPAWGGYPGPTVPPGIAIPPPVDLFKQPAGQINILLLGSDQRPNDGGFRTDTLLLLTINPNAGTVHLTSFPRDLYVYIPGWTVNRINTAVQRGGFELMQATMGYNLGVEPDYYVLINFWGFVNIINSLGGIYVDVANTITDHRDGMGEYTVYAGNVYMDGETALWYVRSRYSSSDFERTRRQQEVLIAMFSRLTRLDAAARAGELFNIYKANVETNLTYEILLSYLPLAVQIGNNPDQISRFAIGREQVTPYTTSGGASVQLPIRDSVIKVMREALNAP